MTLRKAIASLLQLFAVFALFFVGLSLAVVSHVNEVRMRLVDLLLREPEVFTLVGAGFFVGTALLLLGFYGVSRGRFLRIRMGGEIADVKPKVLRRVLQESMKRQFQNQVVLEGVEMGAKEALEIAIWLRPKEEAVRRELLVLLEKELKGKLSETFAYKSPFFITVRE